MAPTGEGRKKILILGSAPDRMEDRKGDHFKGPGGRFLADALRDLGIDPVKDVRRHNTLACRPPDDADPTDDQIACCKPWLNNELDKYPPTLIITLGSGAIKQLLAERVHFELGGAYKWRGRQVPDQEWGAWIAPVFHPNFVMNSDYDQDERIWLSDLRKAVECLDRPFPKKRKMEVKHLSPRDSAKWIKKLLKNPPKHASFDYETTCLRAHARGAKALSAAIAISPTKSVSFLLTEENREAWRAFLRSDIKKIAANMQFEESWSRVHYGTEVKNWWWDVTLASHILDQRMGTSNMDWISYVRYGILDYSSHMSSLKKSPGNSANGINRMEEAEESDLLEYNGKDALLEYRIAFDQREEMSQKQRRGYDLFHDGSLTLVDLHSNGWRIDREYCASAQTNLDSQIVEARKEVMSTVLGKAWRKTYGKKTNPGSDDQLSALLLGHFRDDLPKKPKKTPAGKRLALDGPNLSLIKTPGTSELTHYRHLVKMDGTYLKNIVEECSDDGFLRCFYYLYGVRTFRSRSSNINGQNIPTRDPMMGKLIRSAFYARKGHQIVEADFSGLEVMIAACYHRDPVLLKYLRDGYDFHKEYAMKCFKLPTNLVTKHLRYCAKNMFVFPQFYGDWWGTCAESMWQASFEARIEGGAMTANQWLCSQGLFTLDLFGQHIKEVEWDLWDQFKVYAAWKKKWHALYSRRGYFDMKTGFRIEGIMKRNDVINYPVQGAAFHCLLWSLTRVNAELKKRGMKTRPVGQIHDSIILDAHPKELEKVCKLIRRVLTKDLLEEWPWIIVPLDIEIEAAPVDRPWFDKKVIG